jgi:hypothetical protein
LKNFRQTSNFAIRRFGLPGLLTLSPFVDSQGDLPPVPAEASKYQDWNSTFGRARVACNRFAVGNGVFDGLVLLGNEWLDVNLKHLVNERVQEKMIYGEFRKLRKTSGLMSNRAELLEKLHGEVGEVGDYSKQVDWEGVSEDLNKMIRKKSMSLRQTPNAVDCFHRFNIIMKNWSDKEKWTTEEEERLRELSSPELKLTWIQIAERLGTNRSPMCCFKKFQSSLNTNLVKS